MYIKTFDSKRAKLSISYLYCTVPVSCYMNSSFLKYVQILQFKILGIVNASVVSIGLLYFTQSFWRIYTIPSGGFITRYGDLSCVYNMNNKKNRAYAVTNTDLG